jgi:hypothetical protein
MDGENAADFLLDVTAGRVRLDLCIRLDRVWCKLLAPLGGTQ